MNSAGDGFVSLRSNYIGYMYNISGRIHNLICGIPALSPNDCRNPPGHTLH